MISLRDGQLNYICKDAFAKYDHIHRFWDVGFSFGGHHSIHHKDLSNASLMVRPVLSGQMVGDLFLFFWWKERGL